MIRMELVGVNIDFYPVPLLLSSLALLGPPVVAVTLGNVVILVMQLVMESLAVYLTSEALMSSC